VVCSNALNRAVKELKETETGRILDKTRELVIKTFEKSNEEVKDGMDISLLCIDRKKRRITWSGANNPLWYIGDNELKEIKPDKQPIGKTSTPNRLPRTALIIKKQALFTSLQMALPTNSKVPSERNSSTSNLKNYW
jgi:hypothetical protein